MEPAVYALGYPLEYASTEIFGSCHQTSVSMSEGGQLCEYEAATQCDPPIEKSKQEFVVDIDNLKMIIHQNPIDVLMEVAGECQDDVNITGKKMHRYPASIQALDLDERHTAPTVVAIGPYYHDRVDLKPAEKMKCVAVKECINRESGDPLQVLQEMYNVVCSVARGVRGLYDKDLMAGISDHDFLPMMFLDACFLVQYMLILSDDGTVRKTMEDSLLSFFDSNDNEIFHDIMLLENQIPWPVVETVMNFRPVTMEYFIGALKGCLLDRKYQEEKPVSMDHTYQPPHLLGLLRFHIVGTRSKTTQPETDLTNEESNISLSVSPNELAEMGIKLKPNKNTELSHMGLKTTKWPIFGHLFIARLSLDDARASCLVSMAALELCTTSNFGDVEEEDSAVCSYLLLLAMLVTTEEDVQNLRRHHVLLGAGRSNREVLDFFTKLHGLRLGSGYVRTMMQIEHYRRKRRTRTKLYACWYRYKATILIVLPIVISVVSILVSLNKSSRST